MAGQVQRRVLVVASGGGHWIEMGRLRSAFDGLDVAYATVHADYARDVPDRRFYLISDMNRFSPGKLVSLTPQLLWILLKERPDVVVTTGAAPGLVAIALARLVTRARTIWIDSIANCETLSGSGAQAQRFAHRWVTQWPHLAGEGGPEFWGAVF